MQQIERKQQNVVENGLKKIEREKQNVIEYKM